MSEQVNMASYLDLYDYRSRVAAHYRQQARALQIGEEPAQVLQRFRAQRDELFATHPQSALDEGQKNTFQGLNYFPYNPAMRFVVPIDTHVAPNRQETVMNAAERMSITTVGRLTFTIDSTPVSLSLYWLDIYGGGLFLPFRDATAPGESYGGGRYLFDTIKGSDFLRVTGNTVNELFVLDFNYAYNPSCAYNYRWICPLAPVENRLEVAIPAGEKNYSPAILKN